MHDRIGHIVEKIAQSVHAFTHAALTETPARRGRHTQHGTKHQPDPQSFEKIHAVHAAHIFPSVWDTLSGRGGGTSGLRTGFPNFIPAIVVSAPTLALFTDKALGILSEFAGCC